MINQKNPKMALLRGAAWAVAARWIIKGIGFINTLVMARLLMPQDYGVIAMAMLVVGLIQAFLDFGVSTAIMRKSDLDVPDINSAWTLGLIQGILIGIGLMIASPFAVAYFKEPRVFAVMWVLAGCVIFAGSGNIGMTLARKQLIFSLEFKQQIICKIVSVILTILASLYFKDYRGLLVGVASGYIMGWVTSYLMHPYRPKWCWDKVGEIWGFTKWLLLGGIAGFFLHKVDQFIAARVGNTQQYGLYNVGADLGQLPTGELGPAMLRAFLPVLSSIQDDAVRVQKAVLKTISAANTITMPVGVGFAAIAVPATYLLLGPKWIDAVPYVAGFALISTVQFCMSPLGTLLILKGHTRVMNTIGWGEFMAFLVFCLIFVPRYQIVGLVFARFCSSFCGLFFGVVAAKRYCNIVFTRTLGSVARPFIGSVCMGLIVWKSVEYMPNNIAGLSACILLGMVFYVFWTVLSWRAAGRPEGLESTIFDYLQKKYS